MPAAVSGEVWEMGMMRCGYWKPELSPSGQVCTAFGSGINGVGVKEGGGEAAGQLGAQDVALNVMLEQPPWPGGDVA